MRLSANMWTPGLLALGLGLGLGCSTEATNDDQTAAERIASACSSYCGQADVCYDDFVQDDCVADCKQTLGDCMADEQAQALDELEACAADECDEFTGCTIGAELKCTFGLNPDK